MSLKKLPFYMRNGGEVSKVICLLQEKALVGIGHIYFNVYSWYILQNKLADNKSTVIANVKQTNVFLIT